LIFIQKKAGVLTTPAFLSEVNLPHLDDRSRGGREV